MSKIDTLERFAESYREFGNSDLKADRFAKIALRLLSETFLVQDKKADLEDYYQAIGTYRESLESFFRLLDISFFVDRERRLCYIRGDNDRNRLRLKKLETVLLLIFRALSFTGERELSSVNVVLTNVQEVLAKLQETEIYPNGISMSEFRDAMIVLRRYKVIDFAEDATKSQTIVTIYDSVPLLVNAEALGDLEERLSKYTEVSEDEDPEEN